MFQLTDVNISFNIAHYIYIHTHVCVCVHSEVGDESPVGCGDVATAADY